MQRSHAYSSWLQQLTAATCLQQSSACRSVPRLQPACPTSRHTCRCQVGPRPLLSCPMRSACSSPTAASNSKQQQLPRSKSFLLLSCRGAGDLQPPGYITCVKEQSWNPSGNSIRETCTLEERTYHRALQTHQNNMCSSFLTSLWGPLLPAVPMKVTVTLASVPAPRTSDVFTCAHIKDCLAVQWHQQHLL